MIMPDYSLVPVDYQPDFDDYSFAPVDHDPFAADGLTQQAQLQQPPTPTQPVQPQPQSPPQQPATGAGQPGVNGPATGNSPSGSGGSAGFKRFGGAEGGDFPSRNAGIGFESADRAWDAALKEMQEFGLHPGVRRRNFQTQWTILLRSDSARISRRNARRWCGVWQ